VSAAYGASKGHTLDSLARFEPAGAGAWRCGLAPASQRSPHLLYQSGANSSFQSLQLSIDRRLSRNFSILASYTRSKSIDDTSAFLGTLPDKNFPQDSHNYRAERGLSSFDVPNRFVTAYVYHPGYGFEIRGITTLQSGQPFTPFCDSTIATPVTRRHFRLDRPDVLRNPKLSNPSPERWFDTSAFAIAPPIISAMREGTLPRRGARQF
jgi:hypothetical protein